jgi:hypothetical protein
MTTLRVTCVNKRDRLNTHEAITHVGGQGWRWTRQQAIAAIEAGTHALYTYADGKYAWVKVRLGPNGKYLQTQADGQWTNNLLALPECR